MKRGSISNEVAIVPNGRTILLASFAMLCFAANSLFCRMALTVGETDPITYTIIRIASAATVLSLMVGLRSWQPPRVSRLDPRSLAALLVYFLTFAFAYARLGAGVGALVLFGSVQLSMFAVGLFEGERLTRLSWIGNAIALGGLIYLVQPWGAAPDPVGIVLMSVSGLAWGAFSLFARGSGDPVEANAANFICCLLPVAAVGIAAPDALHATAIGAWFAIGSGVVASGLGYVIWYRALQRLPAARAAIVQLSVPALAAIGGTFLLSEPVTLRLVVASVALIGGVALALSQRAP